jgi:hypothetical protein
MAETLPAFGPAALTTVPASIVLPSKRHPRDTRSLARCAITSPAIRSMFFAFSALQKPEQGMRVEPALAGPAISARDDAFRRHPGKRRCRFGILEHNVSAFGNLRNMVGLKHRQAVIGGEDQIAALAKADIGIGAELVLEPAKEPERKLRQADVFRNGELLADRRHGERRRRCREGRVAFDQRDRAGKTFLAQIVGDRTADDGSTDDDNVVAQGFVLNQAGSRQ